MSGSVDARAIERLPWSSDARLTLPGSKSEAARVLIAAALSGQRVLVEGATPCDDVLHLVRGLSTLGFEAAFEDLEAGRVCIGPRRTGAPRSGEIYCGNAGTALRFLISVAAITPGVWTVTGDQHMLRRPIEPLVTAWRALGADVTDTNGCPPVSVVGGAQRGGRVALDASLSSQFLSSLLLVGQSLASGIEIEFTSKLASQEYARLTLAVLKRFGVDAELSPRGARVQHSAMTRVERTTVSGDWSAMGAWTCLNALTGSRVVGANLRVDSGQADEHLAHALAQLCQVGDVELDVSPFPDQFMNLCVVATRRRGTTRFVGGANLRVKECDRIAVMARELGRLGVSVREHPGGLDVDGCTRLRGGVVDPEADHRVAMAFAILGALSPNITISDPCCVAKSYPSFWADFERVRAATRCIAVVGMRGAGKSTFGRALAQRTDRRLFDTDTVFEERFGAIARYVAEHGWERFREHEALIVDEALQPGNIAVLGGGAVEDEHSRTSLRERSIVIWLDATTDVVRARIAKDSHRPSVTVADVLVEIAELAARRRPHFQALAHHVLSADADTDEHVERALALLGAPCRFDPTPVPRSC